MNRIALDKMTVDQLVERFAEIGVPQYEADDRHDRAAYNKPYSEMDEVDQELRARGPDARRQLLRLYDHPNLQVRLKAATRTLGVAPDAARRLLQEIAASKWPPQYLDAGMTLSNLDNGTFKPD